MNNSKHTTALVCNHVLNKENPILYVGHFSNGCEWWATCGEQHDAPEEMTFVSLFTIFEIDPTVEPVFADLPIDFDAQRKDASSSWEVYKIEDNSV